MIFQRDIVSLRQLALDIQKRLDIHIGEATDLVHLFLNTANGVITVFTVSCWLPEPMDETQVSEVSVGFLKSNWWVNDREHNEYADGAGLQSCDAVFFLGYGETTGDKILEGIELVASVKAAKIPVSLPQETVFHKPPSKEAKQTSEAPVVEEVSNAWDGFDEKAQNYPMELDVALQAWTAVSNNPAVGRVRERLERWVRTAYPKLPEAAVSRIVSVCNWDRSGGRPKLGE